MRRFKKPKFSKSSWPELKNAPGQSERRFDINYVTDSGFRALTPHKDLCDRLSKQVEVRNRIAHQAAADYLRFSISYETSDELRMKADEILEAATVADWLYSDVFMVLQDLLAVHAEVFELEKTLFEFKEYKPEGSIDTIQK